MARSDGRSTGRLPELVAAAAVVVPGLLLTAVAALFVTVLAAVLPGSAAGLAELVFALVVGVGVAGTVLLAAIAWVAVGRARRRLRSRLADRRVDWFRRSARLEALVPSLRRFGLSAWLMPDEETGVEVLRRRYVEGDVDEREFERELERLLGGSDSPGGASADRPDESGVAPTADRRTGGHGPPTAAERTEVRDADGGADDSPGGRTRDREFDR